jgi:flagellar hook-associated protein 1 FlgK
VSEDENGYNISMGDIELVKSNEVLETLTPTLVQTAFKEGDLTSGELYGMHYSIEKYTQYYMTQLDGMVKSLVEGEFEL